MVIRTVRASPGDYLRYLVGGNPRDEWEFQVGDVHCKLLNEWRGGAKLFVNGVIVANDKRLFEVSGRKPMLSAGVADEIDVVRTVEVYIRAILSVKARIDIDGVPISNGFV